MWVVHVFQVLWLAQLTCYVVRGMRGFGGLCEMCICFAWGGVGGEGGEWMRRLCLGFTNPVGTGDVLDVCLWFGCSGVVR